MVIFYIKNKNDTFKLFSMKTKKMSIKKKKVFFQSSNRLMNKNKNNKVYIKDINKLLFK